MTTYSEVADPPVSPDVERLIAEARMAYVDFLTSLRAAIHLDEGIENVSTALESLLTIGENWAVIREINFDLTVGLPFARQSEIDLVGEQAEEPTRF